MQLSQVKNIHSLEQLSEFDSLIRQTASAIIKCPETADDIVNSMYLVVYKSFERGKIINGGYVFMVLQNLYKNYLKQYTNRYDFGTKDNESYIPDSIDDFEETEKEKLLEEQQWIELEKRMSALTWYEKSIVKLEAEMSLSKIANKTGISYRHLLYSRKKIREKLGIIIKPKNE